MVNIIVVTRAALLIARRASTWTVDEHLGGQSPECVAVDPSDPTRIYCGTAGAGLLRSLDSGRTWEPVGMGIEHGTVTAIAVSHAERAEGFGVLYAGTEPSAVFRSDTGGDGWVDLAGLRALPSSDTWSFPPRPHTHHVRWIEADASVADRVFVAIEAGALVRTFDRGLTWRDRVRELRPVNKPFYNQQDIKEFRSIREYIQNTFVSEEHERLLLYHFKIILS